MKRKGIFTPENTERTEVDAVASVRSVVNTEDLPNNFQMTELGPLPKEWRVVRLGEVVKLTKGRKPDELIPKYQFGALPYLTADYFRNRLPTEWVPSEYLSKLPFCSKEDVVLIWDGSKAGQVFIGLEGVLASTMVRIDPENQIERHYLYYFLLTQFDLLNGKTTGTTIPHVNKEVFRNLPIPLPPLPEQRAIAHVLRTVQRAKEATEGVIAALRELKKSLMQHLFTYGPVPVGAKNFSPQRESEIGPLPAHWRVVRLGEVVTRAFGGGTPSTNNPDFWGGTIPWTTSAVIQNDDVELCAFQRRITEEGLRNSSTSLAPKGSLLVGTRVGVGKAAVATFDVAISQDLTALILDQHVDAYFVAYLLKSRWYQSWFENNKRGATIKGVPRQDLLKLPIPLPPLDEQREIARMLQAVDAKIAAEQARRAALEELFKSLLHELMSGQIRLSGDLTVHAEKENL
jgi:type I restriction enzyme S subunit